MSMVVTPAATTVFRWFRTWRTILPLRLIFSISSGDLRMIRSSPKLIINSNFAVSLLTSSRAMLVNQAEDLGRDLFHGPIRIDRYQPPLRPVIIGDRRGQLLIGSQATGDDFFAIVFAD